MFGGIGGNLGEDAMYFWLKKDSDGEGLSGKNNYVIHFDPSQIPPTRVFW